LPDPELATMNRHTLLHSFLLPTLLPFVLPVASATAQVVAGDIATTRFSTTSFDIQRGSTTTPYTTAGFGGTGSSFAVLWDPTSPNDFLVGGFDFVGRATITGPGAVSYSLISTSVGIVVGMSWDNEHRVVFIDAGAGQVRQLDPASGQIVDLSIGAQPWGLDANAGAFDPATGDTVVGGNGALYRLRRGTTTAVPIVSGLGGYISGVTFDPVTGDVIATVLTVNHMIRVDAAGAVSNVVPSLSGPNSVATDQNGDFVVCGGTGQVWSVPRAGGSFTLIGGATALAPVNDISVAGGGGGAYAYGQGCAGASGIVQLRATAPFRPGVAIATTSSNHAGNGLGVLILGFSNTDHAGAALPFSLDSMLGTSGCFLNTSMDAIVLGTVVGGALTFPVTVPQWYAGLPLYAQHACFESVAGGVSWSNGVAIRVQ
jgi:hypothetical protein